MGFFSGLLARFGLTTTTRENIFRMLGSFRANQLGMNDSSFLDEGYSSNVDVYSLIKKISDTASVNPLIIESRTSDGWEEIKDTEFHELLNAPNKTKGYTWNDIETMWNTFILATGNGYLLGLNSAGFGNKIQELDVLPSKHVDVEANNNWLSPQVKYLLDIDNFESCFEQSEVGHVRLFNPLYSSVKEMYCGLSPIQVAARVVQVGNDRWDASANIYQNRGAIGLISDQTGRSAGGGRPMTEPESRTLQAAFDRDNSGTHNFGRVRVTNKDLKYIQIAMSPQDLKLIEHGVVNLRAMCNVFGINSSLFNDPANKTYNNQKEAKSELYTNAVIPLNEKKAAKLNELILKNDPTKRFRYDYSNVEALQEDFHEKAKTYTLLKSNGIISANTAADRLGEERSEDENADKLIIANNNILMETLGGKKPDENKVLEILRSLPPLTANKIIEALDLNKVRAILDLEPIDLPEPPPTPETDEA